MVKRIAVFNDDMHLVGDMEVADDHKGGVDPGDLPLNGTYKYNEERGQFIPLGHGFEKPKISQPHSLEYVIARIVDVMGDNAPIEAIQWRDWYNDTLRQRDEELAAGIRNRAQ